MRPDSLAALPDDPSGGGGGGGGGGVAGCLWSRAATTAWSAGARLLAPLSSNRGQRGRLAVGEGETRPLWRPEAVEAAATEAAAAAMGLLADDV